MAHILLSYTPHARMWRFYNGLLTGLVVYLILLLNTPQRRRPKVFWLVVTALTFAYLSHLAVDRILGPPKFYFTVLNVAYAHYKYALRFPPLILFFKFTWIINVLAWRTLSTHCCGERPVHRVHVAEYLNLLDSDYMMFNLTKDDEGNYECYMPAADYDAFKEAIGVNNGLFKFEEDWR